MPDVIKLLKKQFKNVEPINIDQIDTKNNYYNKKNLKNMLRVQLSNSSYQGSRLKPDIIKHCEWIHQNFSGGANLKILDLCCGPGYYSIYLSEFGHTCYGIDINDEAIIEANSYASKKNLNLTFKASDITTCNYSENNDLVIMPYSNFNEFKEFDALTILEKVYGSLRNGGVFYLESYLNQLLSFKSKYQTSWYFSDGEDFFSEEPYLCLIEFFLDFKKKILLQRFHIAEYNNKKVKLYENKIKFYSKSDYINIFKKAGFKTVSFVKRHSSAENSYDDMFINIVGLK